MRNFFKIVLELDRRWIFLTVAIVVVLPLLFPIGLPTDITPPVQTLYDAIDNIPANDKPLLISFDYGPDTAPELDPMAKAIMRHCFSKNIRIMLMSLYADGAGMAQRALESVVSNEFPDKKSGVDYTFLGFIPGSTAVILNMGQSIHETFPSDGYGYSLSELPMMESVDTYEDIPLMVDISGSATPRAWLSYAQTRFRQEIGVGTTAVSAAEYYPYLQTGQFKGMLGGLKGAAEYEELNARDSTYRKYFVDFYKGDSAHKEFYENYNGHLEDLEKEYPQPRREATIGMDSQSLVHILIMFLIIVGNIAFFVTRKGNLR